MSGIPGTYKPKPELSLAEREGTIGVMSGELLRFAQFGVAMSWLQKPIHARMVWKFGNDLVGNCNAICREMVGEWVWIMGDDHVFAPDILMKLLAHDVDIVVPICMKRTPPYTPVVFRERAEPDEYGNPMYAFGHGDMPDSGLHEVAVAGSAGMLIKRWVLDAIGDPWFVNSAITGVNEDFAFCDRAAEAGARIWCDYDLPLGHSATHTVWPIHANGRWHGGLELSADLMVPLRTIYDDEEVPA